MKTSTKLRHWIAILIATATLVIAVWAFADFSGTPAAQARSKWVMVCMALMIATQSLNLHLDKREANREKPAPRS